MRLVLSPMACRLCSVRSASPSPSKIVSMCACTPLTSTKAVATDDIIDDIENGNNDLYQFVQKPFFQFKVSLE